MCYRSSILIVITFFLNAFLTEGALASNTSSGKIGKVAISADGHVHAAFLGSRTTIPSCQSTVFPQTFGFDASTAKGQAILSIILTDRALGKSVIVYGRETCTAFSNIEDVEAITEAD